MANRSELVEATLDALPSGVALVDPGGRLAFWNRTADHITGHTSADLIGRQVPEALEPLLAIAQEEDIAANSVEAAQAVPVIARHKDGHHLALNARLIVLRDDLGQRIGLAVIFRSAASLETLPRGESGEAAAVKKSQSDLEERLEEVYEEFSTKRTPFGLVWINADQGHDLRKTHGAPACEAMLEEFESAILSVIRPGEEMGRWGEDEFLVLVHEPSAEALNAHAQRFAGAARIAQFRWWGDRIGLTASVGAAQACEEDSLAQLLDRAREAMHASMRAGGNHVTLAPEVRSCSR